MDNEIVGYIRCTSCGFEKVPVKVGKGGSLSSYCPDGDCRAQTIVRSPSGVTRMRARLSGAPGDQPANDNSFRIEKL